MRRRALLAIFVVLLLVGAYGAYVVSYPKYPEVDGCVNPFAVTKPVAKIQENWSRAHMFFKLATMRDFWKLAKPWDVDYSHVKIVKHTIEYNGEKITMLAVGIPLKDKKHVIAMYEFSKPVQGVKVRGYIFNVDQGQVKIEAVLTNGRVTPLSGCQHECSTASDCGPFGRCIPYCCDHDWGCIASCCGDCAFSCGKCAQGDFENCLECLYCVIVSCPYCATSCCEEEGTYCDYLSPGP